MERRRHTVLLVDDDPFPPAVVERLLAGDGEGSFELTAATGLPAALDVLGDGRVDVVLVDPALAESDPAQTLRRVVAAASDAPVVVLAAHDDDELATEALRQGAHEVVVKARLDGATLLRAIRRARDRQSGSRARLARMLAREVLPRTEGERRRLLARLVSAQEAERRRIAGDLHDDPVQAMTSMQRRLEELHATLADPQQRGLMEDVLEDLAGAIGRLRSMTFELRPPALEQRGLADAIRLYLQQDSEHLEVTLDDRLSSQPPSDVQFVLYRLAQEALANARKHAYPERVQVVLENRAGGYYLRVTDDGVGFSPDGAQEPGHLGLTSLRERAEMSGGWCRIASTPGKGTTVECWIPDGGRSSAEGASAEASAESGSGTTG